MIASKLVVPTSRSRNAAPRAPGALCSGFIAFAALALAAGPALAVSPSDEDPANATVRPPGGASAARELLVVYDRGFVVESRDGAYVLRLGGYAQIEGKAFVGDTAHALPDQIVARSLRPTIEGTVFRYVDLRLQPDFGQGKAIIQDGYADVHFVPWARVRVGKMKSPFGLERLQAETDLSFVERALPTQLAPNRDLGLQIHGSVADGAFDYAVGGFDGVADGGSTDGDVSDGKDVTGRLFARPLRATGIRWLRDVGVGFAASYGQRLGSSTSPDLPSLKTSGGATFFGYRAGSTIAKTVIANGANLRLSPQASAFVGPVGAWFELVRSRQEVSLGRTRGAETLTAWQIAGTVVIGGEASWEGARPRRAVGEGGFGAAEIVARYGRFDARPEGFSGGFVDPTRSARRVQAFAVGVNYLFHRSLKLQLDVERSVFGGGASVGDRAIENALLALVQAVL